MKAFLASSRAESWLGTRCAPLNPFHDRVYPHHFDPDAYALSVYDAMWVIAKTVSSYTSAQTDFSVLKSAFTNEADQYYGITGPVVLNSNGDREVGSFDYWGIVNNGGVYQCKLVGKSL